MNKIKNFEKYVNENILFPRGGNIGGEHKKSVTDEEIESGKARKKGYQPQPKGITNAALNIENEKRSQRKINLMGSELNGYNEKNRVENVINSVEYYKKSSEKHAKDGILNYLKQLPKEVIEHFDINLKTDNVVDDFIKNKYELFKRSFDMFNEIKDYSTRYYE